MKRIKCFLAVLTLGMILTAGIGQAMAYFTTYTDAKGGYVINLGDKTEIKEEFLDWIKHISVVNYEGSEAVYIRVKAFSTYELQYSDEEGKWVKRGEGDDAWYYYTEIVEPGQSTSKLDIKIVGVPKYDKDNPESGPEDGESFNVIVIYESTPVRYGEDGEPLEPDWNEILERRTEGGGN